MPSAQAGNWHWVILAFALIGFGLFAQYLNQALYQHQAPFFDSISYYDRVFDVVSIRQQEGLLSALLNATTTSSTICLPYLLAIPFSYFMEASRSIGVWIEVGYFTVFLVSFAAFLRQLGGNSREISFNLIPFFLVGALYRSTAGISDLRLDLPMAWLYVASACWILIGLRTSQWRHFVFAGILVGAACLSRAIAPVYFGIGFVPLICHRFYWIADRKKFLWQILVVIGVAFGLAGWFYLLHFKFIYYYYFIWNTDANAGVTLGRSFKHVLAALKSIGPYVGIFFLTMFAFGRPVPGGSRFASAKPFKKISLEIRWLFWLSCAPILFLILKRADINPFVSLPGSIAFVACGALFLFDRILMPMSLNPRFRYLVLFGVVLFFGACAQGYLNHSRKTLNNAAAHRKILQLIQIDAEQSNRERLTYGVNLMTSLSVGSLESMLQFDWETHYVNETTLEIGGIQYVASYDWFLPSKANWDKVPGELISGKIAALASRSAKNLDYLIAPTFDSISQIQLNYNYAYSSQFADLILRQFQQSKLWIPISGAIDLEPGIKVQVFKNKSANGMSGKKNQKPLLD